MSRVVRSGLAPLERMGIENPVHLIFLGAVALIVLGPKRLPELARALGKGIREFREGINVGETTGSQTHESQTQLLQPAPLHVEPQVPELDGAQGPLGAGHGVPGAEPAAGQVLQAAPGTESAAGQVREEDRGLT